MVRHSIALGIFLFGAGASLYAGTIVVGQVGQNLAGVPTHLYDTGQQNGSPVSDNIGWNFTCSTCTGYGLSANGAATVNNGSLGASSSLTVTGSPGGALYGIASSDALFTDMLTITGGIAGSSGILELTYTLDGVMSNTGTGLNSSSTSLNMTGAADFQYDNEGMESGGYVEVDGNGTYNDTVTFYVPFTYGTALSTELDLDASASFVPVDSTPYTATVNYYNTAAPTSVLVFDNSLDTENNSAVIDAASGLTYGPNGVSATPEPGTWFLLACSMGLLAFAKRRVAFRAAR